MTRIVIKEITLNNEKIKTYMMKTKFTFLILVLLSLCVKGQDIGKIIVKYENGSLPSVLPSGVDFIIEGNAISSSGKAAQAVNLIIKEEKLLDSNKFDIIYSKFWVKGTSDKFIIPVAKQLYPGRKYKFCFEFYTDGVLDNKLVGNLLDSIITRTSLKFKKNLAISLSEQKVIVKDVINNISKDYPSIGYIENDEVKKGIKISNNNLWLSTIMNYSATLYQIDNTKKQIIEEFNEIKRIITNDESLKTSDLGNLIKAAENYSEVDSSTINSEIKKFGGKYPSIVDYNKQLNIKSGELAFLNNKEEDLFNKVKDEILNEKVVFQENKEIITNTSPTETDESTKDRLGIRYGIAWAPFFGDKNHNTNLVNVVTTRIYFFPVNKSMDKPFRKMWDLTRLGMNLGAAISSMKYEGVELENTGLGMKLLTGISWDINKNFSFSAGGIWYDINEGTPFKSVSRTKAVFYFAITFDFNLIETLKIK